MKPSLSKHQRGGDQEWFVEQFHLSSPLEEFETHARLETERRRAEDPQFDGTLCERAMEMVMTRLQPGGGEDDQ